MNGQFVYASAIRLDDGVYSVELKLDDPKVSDKAQFKGQTLKTKIADVSLSAGPRSLEPLPASDGETSAVETVRLGDFANPQSTTAGIVPQSAAKGNAAMWSAADVKQSQK